MRIIFLLVALLITHCSFAEVFRFRSYEAENSAPYSEINHIFEDSYGYIWIASNNGLIKFDGNKYKTYIRKKNEEFSLPHNVCSNIMEDKDRNVWVSTGRGIAIYNREKDNFSHIVFKDRRVKGVLKVIQESDNTFWVLTSKDILRYNKSKDQAIKFDVVADDIIDCKDCIWATSQENGISIINKNNLEISILPETKDASGKVINKHTRTLYNTSSGDIYVGTTDNGFFIYDHYGNMKKHINMDTDPAHGLKSNYVITFFEDKKHNVWIGCVNGNLSTFNQIEYKFNDLKYEVPSNIAKEHFTTSCILQDSYNNIWLGTHRFWLLFSNRTNNKFIVLRHNNLVSNTISDNAVAGVVEDNGEILICTDGGGINICKNGKFSVRTDMGQSVLDIKPDNIFGRYWISTWDSGLYLYDKKNDKILKHYTNTGKNALPSEKINCITVDKDYVWMGTSGKGVVRLNKKTDEIISCVNSTADPYNISNSKFITHLMIDNEGWLWISSSEGLRKFRNNEEQVKFNYSDQPGDLNQNQITMTYQDSKNRIWVLTNAGGLFLYNPKDQKFISYEKSYSLPSMLKFMQEDNDGNLWIGASEELVKFNPDTKNVERYDLKKELDRNTIYHNSAYKDHAGKIYFGSNNGLFIFNPADLSEEKKEPNIYLSNLYIWDEVQLPGVSKILSKTMECTDTIVLNHEQNYFSIEFTGIDFGRTGSIQYSYFMDGLTKEWIEAGSERKASFTNLSPQKYVFKVRALAGNGKSYEINRPLTIIISPPWWSTWWFRTLMVLLTATIVYAIIRFRVKNLRLQKDTLETQVEERTKELQMKNAEIKKQKESVELKNRELDEMLFIKNRILSIVGHDLKNPVTAISGMLSLIVARKRDKSSPDSKKLIEVNQTAQQLQSQMDNILQWAKIQTKEILYNPMDFNFANLIKNVVSLMQGLASAKGISISLNCSLTRNAYADERMISTILRNLINNAIKFTNKKGNIVITVTEDDQKILCSVKDDGVGMSKEKVDKLFTQDFNEATNGTDNEKGSGLGLKICYDFIKANKGEICVKSNPEEGTDISFTMPIGEPLSSYEKINRELVIDQQLQEAMEEQNKGKDKPTVLIVDDNNDILSYLRNLFIDEYYVETAGNGAQALEMVKTNSPNVIVSDIVMPKMNGKELCATLKQDATTRHIPIIILSSEDSKDILLDCLNLGVDDYITKPFESELLLAKVRTLVRNREMQLAHTRMQLLSTPDIEMPESKDDLFLKKFVDLIKDNISEPTLSVEYLAAETALSRVQLFRKIKALTGCTPSDYVKNYRLQYAATMLKSGKYSVADVAYECGFTDPKYFGLCFADKFGMPPSVYAKSAKASDPA